MPIFLENRYTEIYYKIIHIAESQKRKKDERYYSHHIIPRSIGGTNTADNLVLLTYKEHRVCHCLLVKMQISKNNEIKMRHAYGFFNKFSRFNGPRYKRGKENVFSSVAIKQMVKERMIKDNPMKDPAIQQKRLETWRQNRKLMDKIPPRVLKDKFVTPYGVFKTKKAIIEQLNIPEWTLNTIFNDLDALPTSNGRKSKLIEHLNLDYNKSWRENGFSLL